jgi:hypothetical protein
MKKGRRVKRIRRPYYFIRLSTRRDASSSGGFRSRFFHKSIKRDNYAGLTLPVLVEAASIGIRDHEAEVKWRTGERGR